MQRRRDPLAVGEYYHVFTKSIAGYVVFNDRDEFIRMEALLDFHRIAKPRTKFSWVDRFKKTGINSAVPERQAEKLVRIVAYCLMPTHIHLFLQQLMENGISLYLGRLLNSYARYFNMRHKRKGPLWEGRFKNVRVKTDEQAIHLSRYIHLNPTTAALVSQPYEWEYSSYHEYLSTDPGEALCEFKHLFAMSAEHYRAFVETRQSEQRSLAMIKHLLVD